MAPGSPLYGKGGAGIGCRPGVGMLKGLEKGTLSKAALVLYTGEDIAIVAAGPDARNPEARAVSARRCEPGA